MSQSLLSEKAGISWKEKGRPHFASRRRLDTSWEAEGWEKDMLRMEGLPDAYVLLSRKKNTVIYSQSKLQYLYVSEPTGYGYALTSVDPLPFPLQFPLSKAPTASWTSLKHCSSFPVTNAKTASWPKETWHRIPSEEWPTVLRRVVENQEPLRKVADDYGVSYETVRRTVLAARKQSKTR